MTMQAHCLSRPVKCRKWCTMTIMLMDNLTRPGFRSQSRQGWGLSITTEGMTNVTQ